MHELTFALRADKTCGVCSDRHRLQTALECNLQYFQDDAALVDAKCCDDGVSCGSGVPTTCDAKCALTYVPFFDRCANILATQVPATSMASYHRLYTTCSASLPVEPLLQAAAICGAEVDECVSSPCLNGGACVDGDESYSCLCPAGFDPDHDCNRPPPPPPDGCGVAPADCFSTRGCRTPAGRCVSFTCRRAESSSPNFCSIHKGAGWSGIDGATWVAGELCEDIFEGLWQVHFHSSMCHAAGTGSTAYSNPHDDEDCDSFDACSSAIHQGHHGGDSAIFLDRSFGYYGPSLESRGDHPCASGMSWRGSTESHAAYTRLTICQK